MNWVWKKLNARKNYSLGQKQLLHMAFPLIVCIHTALYFGAELCLNTKMLCVADRR